MGACNAAHKGRRALVVFVGESEVPLLRLLRPGFRHCFVAIAEADCWITYDPLIHRTEINVLPVSSGFDLAALYRSRGFHVVAWRLPEATPHRAALCRPFTCVEAVKRVLGIHRRRIVTPWQLYRHLVKQNRGASSRRA
jgi:hypothetical protein